MRKTPRISSTVLDTHFGEFEFHCFNWSEHEEDNVLALVKRPFPDPLLVRVQSACYTAEIFRSRDCDCHEQLELSLNRISNEGGVLIYMLCDGRGAGLYQKVLGLELGRTQKLDTSDAYRQLGLKQDPRTYERVVFVLNHFGIRSVKLLTNNPRKMDGLTAGGIRVIREPLQVTPTAHSRPYLETKANKMGHFLDFTSLDTTPEQEPKIDQ